MKYRNNHFGRSWVWAQSGQNNCKDNKGNAKRGVSPRLKIWPGDLDLWPWKSIGFQILLRTKYEPSLVKIHWRMLILECSQGCYGRTDGWKHYYIPSQLRWRGDNKIGICCFSAKNTALRSKSKDWLALNQDNVSEWRYMSTCVLLFHWAGTIKILLSVLV